MFTILVALVFFSLIVLGNEEQKNQIKNTVVVLYRAPGEPVMVVLKKDLQVLFLRKFYEKKKI